MMSDSLQNEKMPASPLDVQEESHPKRRQRRTLYLEKDISRKRDVVA
jgi:hypothetical protein